VHDRHNDWQDGTWGYAVMSATMNTALLPRPKSIEEARSAFQREMGDPRTLCKYLTVGLTAALGVIAMLVMQNGRISAQQRERIVVRVDDVGRAQAVGVSTSNYKLQAPEAKYFLAQFVHTYYGRNRATWREDATNSMMFLSQPLAAARQAVERRDKTLEKWAVSGQDEVAIQVNNIVLGDLTHAPYGAQVDLEKIYSRSGSAETRRQKFVDGITFTMAGEVSNSALLVNPLAFVILEIHENEAF
jgi:type IV secretory pathway TrbF-like protein